MTFGLTIKSWRGVELNGSSNYEADFDTGDGASLGIQPRPTVETTRPGRPPVRVYNQPQGLRFSVRVTFAEISYTQTLLDGLKILFATDIDEEGELLVEDGDGNERRILAVVEEVREGVVDGSAHFFDVVFYSAGGLWEGADLSYGATDEGGDPEAIVISSDGQTFELVNGGTAETRPTIRIAPIAMKASSANFVKRRRIHVVNRALGRPLIDPNGGYPLELTFSSETFAPPAGGPGDGRWDMTDSAATFKTNLDDVRVLVNSVDVDRYFYVPSENATQKVWINQAFQEPKLALLRVPVDAADTEFEAAITPSQWSASYAYNGFVDWPVEGFALFVDSTNTTGERVKYVKTSPTTISVVRGVCNTTPAAHGINARLYWLEHPFIDLIYEYSGAGIGPQANDRRPVFSYGGANNDYWPYGSQVFPDGLQTGGWYITFTDDGPGSKFLRIARGSGNFAIENLFPAAGKPLGNNVVLEVPVGLNPSGAAIQFVADFTNQVPIEGVEYRRTVTTRDYDLALIFVDDSQIEYYPAGPDNPPATYSWNTYQVEQQGVTVTVVDEGLQSSRGPSSSTPTIQSFPVDKDVEVRTDPSTGNQTLHVRTVYERGTVSEVDVDYTEEEHSIVDGEFLIVKAYLTDREGYESAESIAVGDAYDKTISVYSEVYRVRFNAEIPIGTGADGEEYTNIPDSARNSGARFEAASPLIHHNPLRTPGGFMGPEEDLYLLNCRITNEELDEYIDLIFPMAIGESVEIDAANQRVIDSETGIDIPFAMGGDWPRMIPGSNTFRYDETGVVNTELYCSWRNQFH